VATYVELASEEVWQAEYVTPAMDQLANRLRSFYGVGPALIGCKGDNNHLSGYHRSRRWTEESVYCTNRTYGNTYPLDAAASTSLEDALRAYDIQGMPDQVRWDFNHRLDAAVRAGMLPAVAQWWGTFDGQTVVGWSYGKPSVADSTHLFHTHISIWTGYVNNFQQMQLLGDIITGDDMTPEEHAWLAELHLLATQGKRTGAANTTPANDNQTAGGGVPLAWWPRQFFEVDGALSKIPTSCPDCGGGTVGDLAPVLAKLDAMEAENRALRQALAVAYMPPPVV
jgi:hypothetical protein